MMTENKIEPSLMIKEITSWDRNIKIVAESLILKNSYIFSNMSSIKC